MTTDDHAEWICERCGALKLGHDIGQPWRRSLQSGLALCDPCHQAERTQAEPSKPMTTPSDRPQQMALFP
jgi:hypothetical protein